MPTTTRPILEVRRKSSAYGGGKTGPLEFLVDDYEVDKEIYMAVAAGVQATALQTIADQIEQINDNIVGKAVREMVDAAVAHAAGVLRGVS
jgi:hypothetical protein